MYHYSANKTLILILILQAEEEMKAKMLLIQEIRAMESKPVIRHKLVDLTTTGGYGFLSEMSIAEVNMLLVGGITKCFQTFPRSIHLKNLIEIQIRKPFSNDFLYFQNYIVTVSDLNCEICGRGKIVFN